jgi:hypothetical protein
MFGAHCGGDDGIGLDGAETARVSAGFRDILVGCLRGNLDGETIGRGSGEAMGGRDDLGENGFCASGSTGRVMLARFNCSSISVSSF